MAEAHRSPAAAPVICVDGPSASGKGVLAQGLARALRWRYLDSGALYRALAAAALERGCALDDEAHLVALAADLDADFEQALLPRTGGAFGRRLRSEAASAAASKVAAHPGVRTAILARQRLARRAPGLVADGRDMGTQVFPGAELKIYLDASPEIRAKRRHKQLLGKGLNVSFAELLAGIRERDRRDAGRTASPLLPAEGAVVIDSTRMHAGEVLETALALARRRGLGAETAGGGARMQAWEPINT